MLVGLLAAAALLAVVAVPSSASIRAPRGHYREDDDRRSPDRGNVRYWRPATILRIDGHSHGEYWDISAPTLQFRDCYLTYDASGKSTAITLREDKGPGTSWALVELKHFQRRKGFFLFGPAEEVVSSMKLQATEGPFKGWYLCREKDRLVLTKEYRDAAKLEVVETLVER
jgi:hypothetical protein